MSDRRFYSKTIYLTREEEATLYEQAKLLGISTSELGREIIFGALPPMEGDEDESQVKPPQQGFSSKESDITARAQ